MAKQAQLQAITQHNLGKGEDVTMVRESDPPKNHPARECSFRPSLTMGILASRWMRSYATPCHAQGASI